MDRRRFIERLSAGALAGAAAALSTSTANGMKAIERGPAGSRNTPARPQPLPFDPRRLRGLSERLIVSHHDNNYAGAVANLAKVEVELERVTPETPAFILNGLKERELTFTNSVILHELYFQNLGGDGKPAGAVHKALSDASGTLARWEESFRATGMSLAGGSGWVVLDFNFQSGALRTYWSGSHSQALAFGAPLLVMDMYEHAYHIDYGAAAARYVDAFFQNIDWEVVNHRLERARKAAAVS